MRKYKCHKVVEAFKIAEMGRVEMSAHLLKGPDGERCSVTEGWVSKHNPQIGGYLVRYKDGYTSYSPAEAFEEGYTLEKDDDSAIIKALRESDERERQWLREQLEENMWGDKAKEIVGGQADLFNYRNTFGWAIQRLREGERIARKGWISDDPKWDMWLVLVKRLCTEPMVMLCVPGKTDDGHRIVRTEPMPACHTDMLAMDWVVVGDVSETDKSHLGQSLGNDVAREQHQAGLAANSPAQQGTLGTRPKQDDTYDGEFKDLPDDA